MSSESDGQCGRPPDPNLFTCRSAIGKSTADARNTCLNRSSDMDFCDTESVISVENESVSSCDLNIKNSVNVNYKYNINDVSADNNKRETLEQKENKEENSNLASNNSDTTMEITKDLISDDNINDQNKSDGRVNPLNNLIRFEGCDMGPYTIFVESKDKNIGRLHPMALGKIIHNAGAYFKFGLTEVSVIGKNKVKMEFKSARVANKILDDKILEKNNLKAYIPKYLLARHGIIFDVDANLSEQEIINAIETDIPIIDVVCLRPKNNNTIKYSSQCVKLTFRGTSLPNKVAIHSVKCEVRPFVQKVVQCYKCCRFNHVKDQCRGKERCMKCSGEYNAKICIASKFLCALCNGDHPANDKECTVFIKNKKIKEIMAWQNLAYHEARNILYKDSYANKSKVGFSFTGKDKEFPGLYAKPASSTDSKITKNRFDALSDLEEEEQPEFLNPTIFHKPKRATYKITKSNTPFNSGSSIKNSQ
ncbi:uncharacterized protein LOC113390830 [Ctenocephalides felis]|uniref:uncharacterized protein LOC113390830 n=1 Tax=Ctenocephalides felis TaxID=7515 RepID=UPI000E6E374D|nr:uncharacterized protein LOC113390830 [Ctenocephalides felis]